MHESIVKLNLVKNKVKEIINKKQLKINTKIIVVTKTFPLSKILPLLNNEHIDFGENKIQEAEEKWSENKNIFKNIKLHMIGKLQSNKVKKAVQLFDYIHSLDNKKLALKIYEFEKEFAKKIKLFIQINVGHENQKSGILINELENFYNYCTKELDLNIIGLMCIPPVNSDSSKYFKLLKENADKLNLKELSMGMSADYEKALLYGASYLRLGTAILGERKII